MKEQNIYNNFKKQMINQIVKDESKYLQLAQFVLCFLEPTQSLNCSPTLCCLHLNRRLSRCRGHLSHQNNLISSNSLIQSLFPAVSFPCFAPFGFTFIKKLETLIMLRELIDWEREQASRGRQQKGQFWFEWFKAALFSPNPQIAISSLSLSLSLFP